MFEIAGNSLRECRYKLVISPETVRKKLKGFQIIKWSDFSRWDEPAIQGTLYPMISLTS